jgi:predicted DNA-binding protein with PD1-like motif
MLYSQHGDTYVVRFEDGEVFPDKFLEFLSARSIAGGSFTGIGAMQRTRIAFFDVEKREYIDADIDEQVEVLALVGNAALHGGEPLVHAHITLGRRDYTVLGGHLRHGIVRPTLEVTLRVISEPLERTVDPEYGLPALDLSKRI